MDIQLTFGDCNNLSGMVLNEISNMGKNVTDDILGYYLNLYHKLTGEIITLEFARKNYIK